MTTEQVMKEIRKDTLFYFFSTGGVTLSGGDILCQADFARELLKACREDCIDTTAELDMYGPYKNVTKVLEYLNSYFVDIKLIDSGQHRRWTGVENTAILENTLQSSMDFPRIPLYVRVPLIPGVNDSKENINATAEFCKKLQNCKALEFLPYHRLGVTAYQHINRFYSFTDLPSMTFEEAHQRICHLLGQQLPFDVKISGKKI
jgi:pyruvate formate lyase activating enzyme